MYPTSSYRQVSCLDRRALRKPSSPQTETYPVVSSPTSASQPLLRHRLLSPPSPPPQAGRTGAMARFPATHEANTSAPT